MVGVDFDLSRFGRQVDCDAVSRMPVGGASDFFDTAAGDVVSVRVGQNGNVHDRFAGDDADVGRLVERFVLGDVDGHAVGHRVSRGCRIRGVRLSEFGQFGHFDVFDRPVRIGLLDEPGIEPGGPGAFGVEAFHLGLEVVITQDAEGIRAVEVAEKFEEAVVAHAVGDHVDDFAAPVIGQAEQGLQVRHRPEVLNDRSAVALGFPFVVAGHAQIFAADGGHPVESRRPDDQRRVAAVFHVEPARRDAVDEAFVHERFGIAIGADDVPPPLVGDFMGDEVVEIPFAGGRHVEYAVVDHDQAGAFVAVPAEERSHHFHFVVGKRPEPVFVQGQHFGHVIEGPAGVGVVLVLGEHTGGDMADLAFDDLKPVRADDGEIARGRAFDGELDVFVGLVDTVDDAACGGDDLIERQKQLHPIMSGFLMPGLMPGDERLLAPASVVFGNGKNGVPVDERGDAAMVAPAAPLRGEVENEIDFDGDRTTGRERLSQRHDHDGIVVAFEAVFGRLAVDVNRVDRDAVALGVNGFVGPQAQHFEGLGQLQLSVFGDTEFRIDVKYDVVMRHSRTVHVNDFFMGSEFEGLDVQNGLKIVTRQIRRNRQRILCPGHRTAICGMVDEQNGNQKRTNPSEHP